MTDLNLCRLCFTTQEHNMNKLTEDCSILRKISTCLSLTIKVNSSLPTEICNQCVEKINDIHDYREKVIQNEIKLKQYYKKEMNKTKCDVDNNDKLVFKNKQDNIMLINELRDELKEENLDNECFDFHDDGHSSDNETLATIKKAKDITQTSNTEKGSVFNGHNIESNKILTHKCLTCFDLLENKENLAKHYQEEHSLKKCKTINIDSNISMININDSKRYKCLKCEKVFYSKKLIKRHILTSHSDERPYLCNICGRTYKTVHEIMLHDRAHNNMKKLLCKFGCGYSSAYIGCLRDHEKRHMNEFKYTCDTCNKGFLVKTWYEQHQNVHTGVKPYICEICGAAFYMDRYLTAHRAKHPEASSVKRYTCMHCTTQFQAKHLLREHLKTHGVVATKGCLCDFCGKIVKDKTSLKLHKLSHLGVKPYSCSVCNKTFIKKYNLQVHKQSHTGEKTSPCLHCDKVYTRQSNLRRHIRSNHKDLLAQDKMIDSDDSQG